MELELVYPAKLAQMADRYQDMFEIMSSAAMTEVELTQESIELLSTAYQNLASEKRASLHRLESVEKSEKSKGNLTSVRMVKAYRQKVKDELIVLCYNTLKLIDIHLLPHSSVPRSWILLNRMKGDGNRLLASLTEQDEMKSLCDKSLSAYELASEIAKANLPNYDALKLAVDLNTGLLLSELMGSPERAHKLAIEDTCTETSFMLSLLLRDEDTCTETSFMLSLLLDHVEFWETKMSTVQGTCLFRVVGHTPPKEQRTPIRHKDFKGRVAVCREQKLTVLERVPDIKETNSYSNRCEISKLRANIAKVQEKMGHAIDRSTHEKLEREVNHLSDVLGNYSSLEDTGAEVLSEGEGCAGDKGEECAHYYCEQDDCSEPTAASSKQ